KNGQTKPMPFDWFKTGASGSIPPGPMPANTVGEAHIVGIAKYFPDYQFVPSDWADGVNEAGEMGSRENRPFGWRDTVGVDHSLVVAWDDQKWWWQDRTEVLQYQPKKWPGWNNFVLPPML